MKRLLIFLLSAALPLLAVAQATRPVRGVVFDADGVPLQGVTLTAVGSTGGTTTSAVDGTFEMMVSPYTKFIEAAKESFIIARAEVDGSYLVFKLAVDKKYLENKAKAEEEARLAAEAKAKAEEEARLAEERRIAAEKAAAEKAEAERKAAEERARIAEEKRLAAEKAAAEKAEQARLAAEAKAEAERKAAEERARIAEEKRLAAEKAAAEKAEQARLAAEAKAEAERKAAEEKKRLAEEKARLAEEKRLASEKVAAEKAARQSDNTRKDGTAAESGSKSEKTKQCSFGSIVDVSYLMGLNNPYSGVGLTYTAGCNLGKLFYIGAGVGVRYNFGTMPSERYGIAESDGTFLNPHQIAIPAYLYFRANFIDRRCSPFFALAVGGNFSPKQSLHLDLYDVKYSNIGMLANPQLGVNFRTSDKTKLYLAVGFQCYTAPMCVSYKGYSATIKHSLAYGLDFHLGFTF